MSKSKAAATSSASLTTPTSAATSSNGTLHVKVVRARNLPRMDFGKRQDPFGALRNLL